MAIHGNLSDFSLRDILTVVVGKHGVLTVDQRDGQVLRLDIAGTSITRMTVERPIDSRSEGQVLLRMFAQGNGEFRFEPLATVETKRSFLRMDELLEGRGAVPLDERDLPHPKTMFLVIKGRQVELPPDLAEFLGAAVPLLTEGASAERISRQLGFPLEGTRRNLQRLRQVKKVWPMQAYVDRLDPEQRKQRQSLGQRIASFFTR